MHSLTRWDVRFTVKTEVTGLEPYTKYNYRFISCSGADLGSSTVGSFKTLPNPGDDVSKIKLAVYSCSNLPFGFFNVRYSVPARELQLFRLQLQLSFAITLRW